VEACECVERRVSNEGGEHEVGLHFVGYVDDM